MSYYHGGPDGFAEILPPSETRAKHTSAVGPASLRKRAKRVHRTDRVYLTNNYTCAAMFAAGHRKGVIYEVEPVGVLESDPDCDDPSLSFACERAKVIRVHRISQDELAAIRSALFGAMP